MSSLLLLIHFFYNFFFQNTQIYARIPHRYTYLRKDVMMKDSKSSKSKKKSVDPARLCDLANMANEPASTDVLGSYTGMAEDFEPPVQDADDLRG